MKLKKIDLAVCGIYLSCFKIYAIPAFAQKFFKFVIVVFVMSYLFNRISIKRIVSWPLIFSLCVMLSSIYACSQNGISITSVFDSILFGCCILCVYYLLMICSEKYSVNVFIKNFYHMTWIYSIISIISIIIKGTTNTSNLIMYATGNKFEVSYFFLMLATLFFNLNFNKITSNGVVKIKYYILVLLAMFISNKIYCSTAFALSILLLFAPIITKLGRKVMTNPVIIVGTTVICGYLSIAIEVVLNNKFIQYFVTKILNEDMSLTGRIPIYLKLQNIIKNQFWLGYGYGNQIVRKTVGYGNAQNGLMQCLIDYGFIGTISFLLMIYFCCKIRRKKQEYSIGAYLLLYCMIIASVVEISFGFVFFIALFVVKWQQEEADSL